MSYNKVISASDPKALEKLTEKLQKCEELQKLMKEVNAYWRKTGTCMGAPGLTDVQAEKIDREIASTQYPWVKQPFASYSLTNNNSEIKRLKSRIAEITRNREIGFVGWDFNGGKAVINTEINRLQLIFDERPDRDKCSILKSNGFHWSPTEGAWQRLLNDNAIYAAGRMEFVKPLNGKRPSELQPKVPSRDTGAR